MPVGLRKAIRRPRVDPETARGMIFNDVPDHQGGLRLNHSMRAPSCGQGYDCQESLKGGMCAQQVTVQDLDLGPRYLGGHTSIQTAQQATHVQHMNYSHLEDRSQLRPRYLRIVDGQVIRQGPCGPTMHSGPLAHYLTRDGTTPLEAVRTQSVLPEDGMRAGTQCGMRGRRDRVDMSAPRIFEQIANRRGRHLDLVK